MSIKYALKLTTLWAGAIIKRNRGSKILYYHDVFSTINHKALDADICMGTPLALFKEHIRIIRDEGFKIVPQITNPEGEVAIMFDDGFNGIWECREYFFKENIMPTLFLPAAFIGRSDLGILTREQIYDLQNNGFSFECHGWSHRELTQFSDNELKKELEESKIFLSKLLGKEITGLCMPLGYFNNHLLTKIKESGYTDIYSCIPGNYFDFPLGMHPRNLCQYATPQELKLILRGGNEILKNRYIELQQKSEHLAK